jgi:hypothetical protein
MATVHNWESVIKDINNSKGTLDYLRSKYIKELEKHTKINTIVYYSGWMQGKRQNVSIDDSDMEGFMNVMENYHRESGLDIVLHTPGGEPNATSSIVSYLKKMYGNDVRFIVPHMAMSAGTMLCCSGKEIVMGKQSSLGPVDPQFNGGISAYSIVAEFEDAQKQLKKDPSPGTTQFWAIRLQQFPAAFLKVAIDSIDLTNEYVKKWLLDNMLHNETKKAEQVTAFLNDHKASKAHGRHYNIDNCKEIGLKVRPLEDDQELQDLVLQLHHLMVITLQKTSACKIICNESNNYIMNGK